MKETHRIMSATLASLFIFLAITACMISCAEEKPVDTINYNDFDETESNATETQTESGSAVHSETEAETESDGPTESETSGTAVIPSDDDKPYGFTISGDVLSPYDIGGIDLSAFPVGSNEYRIYSAIGRIAVLCRYIEIYEEKTVEPIERRRKSLKDSSYYGFSFGAYVMEQCGRYTGSLKNDLLSLLAAFNVSEYNGYDDIYGMFSNEISAEQAAFTASAFQYGSLFNQKSWQQNMLKSGAEEIVSLCEDLASYSSENLKYGKEISELLSLVYQKAKILSDLCRTYDAEMLDPSYPCRIERELSEKHLKLYIYLDEHTSFDESYAEFAKKAVKTLTTRYDETMRRYEMEFDIADGIIVLAQNPLLSLFDTVTGLWRNLYIFDSHNFDIEDIGEIKEKDIIDSVPSEIRKLIEQAVGREMCLGDIYLLSSVVFGANESGTGSLELRFGAPSIGYVDVRKVYTDDGYMPIRSLKDLDMLCKWGAVFDLTIEKGAAPTDFENTSYISRAVLFGFDDVYRKYKDDILAYVKEQKALLEKKGLNLTMVNEINIFTESDKTQYCLFYSRQNGGLKICFITNDSQYAALMQKGIVI